MWMKIGSIDITAQVFGESKKLFSLVGDSKNPQIYQKIEYPDTEKRKMYLHYLHKTVRANLRLLFGGIPFEAIHKYAPISSRLTLVNFKSEPSEKGTKLTFI
jgi:hypothetical protein